MRIVRNMTAGTVALMLMSSMIAGCNSEETTAPVAPEPTTIEPTTPDPIEANGNTVLVGASFYTVNEAQPRVAALAFDDQGIIIALGEEASVRAAAGDGATIRDLQGAFVMPGFHDLHVHALEAGINENRCLVPAFGSAADYEEAITDCATEQAGSAWVFAAGVSVADLFDVTDSPIEFLDALIPDRPALILDNVGHGAWGNSLALDAVGFLDAAADPQGGIIDRFENGDPTGIVFENAQQPLRTAAFPPTEANLDENYRGLLSGLAILARNGITTVGDAGGYWTRGHEQAWIRAQQTGALTVRASNTLYVFPDLDFDEQVAEITARKTANPSDLVQFDQVKIYTDGILSLGTGALYENYTQDPGIVIGYPAGFEYFDRDQLSAYAVALDAAGFQLHFHATGDRGAGLALDAIEAARLANGQGRAHRITHCYLIDERDRSRFAELNVVADFQIAPSTVGADYRNFIRSFIGVRADDLFPVRSMMDAGATVILTSDWDADEVSPLTKLEIAITRDRQAVPDLETAVRMMTIIPAQIIGRDATTGSLEIGKFADLVVLDADIFTVEASEIDEASVIATMLGGDPVYDRSGLLN